MLIEKRFLKYVSFDTQSDEFSTTSPSTEKQFDLADFLSEEMQILGVDEVERTDQGIVYGKIYSNSDEPMKAIGFIAHMDTSPDASGHDIHPRIIRSYPGGRIILNEEKNHSAAALPGDGVQPDPHHRLGGKQQYRCAASVRRQYRDGRQGQGRR